MPTAEVSQENNDKKIIIDRFYILYSLLSSRLTALLLYVIPNE